MTLSQNVNLLAIIEDPDFEHVDTETRQLLREIRDFDVEEARLINTESIEPGAKAVDGVLLGLAVAVAPLVLTKILEFIHQWSLRREGRNVRIRIERPEKETLEVEFSSAMSIEDAGRWIDFVKSHLSVEQSK